VVRKAQDKEKITLLDGQEVALNDNTLVIADEKEALAIAGVMGGANSGVSSETTNIFLECAFFSPLAIAGKARSYGLHTDSSHRFERGVDYQLQRNAMERATQLLIDIVGGDAGPIIEVCEDDKLPKATSVRLRESKIESLLGIKIENSEVEEILTRLGMTIAKREEGAWVFDVPSYRFDIAIEPDLIEEVGRIYGYNNLPKTTALGSLTLKVVEESIASTDLLADRLVSLGYQEAITYSFVEDELQNQIMPSAESIALANPISADLAVMRTSLWTGLLKAMSYNQNRQQSRVKFFETGLKFEKIEGEIVQTRMLSGVVSGAVNTENWSNDNKSVDFYDVKGDLERLLLPIDTSIQFVKGKHPALHPGQTAQIVKQGEIIGYLGAIHPKLQKTLDLNGPVYMFELCLEKAVQGQVPHFSDVSKYPEVRRDLAILINDQVPFSDVEAVVKDNAGDDLVKLSVFDVYAGENLGEGKQSLALALVWQRVDRTLNDEEINLTFEQIVSALSAKLDAKLRS
jgi:phenylalanyl-tRNA synthetase beta chain